MKFDSKKFVFSGFLGGIVYWVLWGFVSFVLRPVLWPYDPLSLGGMRGVTDPFMLLFFLYPFVFSFCMALVYQLVQPALKGTSLQKGQQFGLAVWVLAVIPGFFMVLSTMNYPAGFFIENLIGGFFFVMATGIVIARFSE
jgi:hypothetical protein